MFSPRQLCTINCAIITLLWTEIKNNFTWLRFSDLFGESKQRCLLRHCGRSGPKSRWRPGGEEWRLRRVVVHRMAAAEPHHWRDVWLEPQYGQVNATETRSRKSNQSELWLCSVSLLCLPDSHMHMFFQICKHLTFYFFYLVLFLIAITSAGEYLQKENV